MKKIAILFLFVSLFAQSQNKGKVDLSNPNATLYTHVYNLMPEHYDIAKSVKTVRGLPKEEAQLVAKRIKDILDVNGYIINFSKVPTDANYKDTIQFVKREVKRKNLMSIGHPKK